MNILFTLHDHFSPDAGGAGVTTGLGETYRRLGHQVEYFSFDELPERLPSRAQMLLFPEFVAGHLAGVVKRARVDIVDSSAGDAWVWAVARSARHRPLLVTRSHGLEHVADIARRREARDGKLQLHWWYPLYGGGYRLWEIGVSLRRADLALFLNHTDRTHAVRHLRVAEERARVVDNGLPAYLLGRPLQPAAAGIVHLGSYLPMKGTRYAAAALGSVLARRPSLRLAFVGAGCEPARVLHDFDPALHARIAVVPKYRRRDLPELLRPYAIVVSATLREGFGLGLLEAMACGLAPVATRTPGPMRFIRDGHNGLLVPAADDRALAAALDLLIDRQQLLGRLREQAQATAQRYSWERVARETLELYEAAIRARGIERV